MRIQHPVELRTSASLAARSIGRSILHRDQIKSNNKKILLDEKGSVCVRYAISIAIVVHYAAATDISSTDQLQWEKLRSFRVCVSLLFCKQKQNATGDMYYLPI